MAPTDRRTRLLEEAVRLVGSAGLEAVTHRSVEKAAGAPHGSVTYWFGSREGLISALVDWLCDESERQVAAIAGPVQAALEAGQAPDMDAVAQALAVWIDAGRSHHVARMELEMQSARDPAMSERMSLAATTFWGMCATICRAMGSTHPDRDGRAMAAMVDGILLDRLSHTPADDGVLLAATRWLLSAPPP